MKSQVPQDGRKLLVSYTFIDVYLVELGHILSVVVTKMTENSVNSPKRDTTGNRKKTNFTKSYCPSFGRSAHAFSLASFPFFFLLPQHSS